MKKFITTFLRDNNGVTAIEYGLIAGLIAVGIVTAAGGVKTALVAAFNAISTAVNGAVGVGGGAGG